MKPCDTKRLVAANMRAYRTRRDLSQYDLAQELGMHRNYIGGIEQERINASCANLGLIAGALEIAPMFLFAPPPSALSPNERRALEVLSHRIYRRETGAPWRV